MQNKAKDSAIVELAKKEFGKLSSAERKLFKAAIKGEIADYSSGVEEMDNPAKAQNWKSNRVIKADRIAWLCTSSEASKRVTYKGVKIKGVRISGELDLSYATIPFHLNLGNCALLDGINLNGVTIRALYLIGTHTGPISAANLKVEGDVYMRKGFKAEGEVFLRGATIGGQLDCTAGQFCNENGIAIDADNLKIAGSVFMSDGFKADGGVILRGATIGGQLDCTAGEFCNKDRVAINADSLKVEESVFMRNGFKAAGKVILTSVTIDQHLFWTTINKTKELSLNLRFAKIGTLCDDEESWPDKGKLQLQGLVYNELDDKAPMEARARMKWLRLQYSTEKRGYDNQFFPQPYEHLAAVLRKTGYEEDARQILIAKAKDYKRLTNFKWTKKIWYFLLWFIDYGYRPWKASWLILVICSIWYSLFQNRLF